MRQLHTKSEEIRKRINLQVTNPTNLTIQCQKLKKTKKKTFTVIGYENPHTTTSTVH